MLTCIAFHTRCRSASTASYCRTFDDILSGRLQEVDVCLSFPTQAPTSRSVLCRDLTGAELPLIFTSSTECTALREIVRRHLEQRGGELTQLTQQRQTPETSNANSNSVLAWLIGKRMLVSWAPSGHVR